ncbi:hypothetical protein BT63DRAFT_422312 [Microthyrium microscopicum]|uniref:Uncharacterized protein n=1 Tax=Microthyrium microscopicum TaxID=703497 RepID=A0A6A6UL51_9PEZI|nr:hypothetical protein BT63DRAFT_422312 [Microthyrium microscopicum]
METELGEERIGDDRCNCCLDKDRRCWVYTERAKREIANPGERCVECRLKVKGTACSFITRFGPGGKKKKGVEANAQTEIDAEESPAVEDVDEDETPQRLSLAALDSDSSDVEISKINVSVPNISTSVPGNDFDDPDDSVNLLDDNVNIPNANVHTLNPTITNFDGFNLNGPAIPNAQVLEMAQDTNDYAPAIILSSDPSANDGVYQAFGTEKSPASQSGIGPPSAPRTVNSPDVTPSRPSSSASSTRKSSMRTSRIISNYSLRSKSLHSKSPPAKSPPARSRLLDLAPALSEISASESPDFIDTSMPYNGACAAPSPPEAISTMSSDGSFLSNIDDASLPSTPSGYDPTSPSYLGVGHPSPMTLSPDHDSGLSHMPTSAFQSEAPIGQGPKPAKQQYPGRWATLEEFLAWLKKPIQQDPRWSNHEEFMAYLDKPIGQLPRLPDDLLQLLNSR